MKIPIKPLSQNHVYRRSRNGRMFMVREGHEYKEALAWHFKSMGVMYLGPVRVDIHFEMPDMRTDPANCLKLLLDAMQGTAIKNDRQVRDIMMTSSINKENPSITVAITEKLTCPGVG